MDSVYRGGRGWGGWVGGGGGWGAEGGLYHPQGDRQQHCVFSRVQKQPVDMVGRDGRWQQLDTPCSLISVPQWPHTPCSGLTWFSRVGKRPPVKADWPSIAP